MSNLTILLVINIILLIGIALLVLLRNKRKEGYLGDLPDDLVITDVLPYSPLPDLINLSISDPEGARIVHKYVTTILKFKSVCDLRDMVYFKTVPSRKITRIGGGNKPTLPVSILSNMSFNILQGVIDLLKPQPLFKKYIRQPNNPLKAEWIIFNSSNISYIYKNDRTKFESSIDYSYVSDSPNHIFVNFIRKGLNTDMHIWIRNRKYAELRNFLDNKIIEINNLTNEYFTRSLKGSMEEYGDEEGFIYKFTLALKMYDPKSGYKYYVRRMFKEREEDEEDEEIEEEDEEKKEE